MQTIIWAILLTLCGLTPWILGGMLILLVYLLGGFEGMAFPLTFAIVGGLLAGFFTPKSWRKLK